MFSTSVIITLSPQAVSTAGRPRSQALPKQALPNPFTEEPASGANPFGDSSINLEGNNPFEDSVSPVEILGGNGNPF